MSAFRFLHWWTWWFRVFSELLCMFELLLVFVFFFNKSKGKEQVKNMTPWLHNSFVFFLWGLEMWSLAWIYCILEKTEKLFRIFCNLTNAASIKIRSVNCCQNSFILCILYRGSRNLIRLLLKNENCLQF